MLDALEISEMVCSVNQENSIRVHLYHDTRTTPIMDSYSYSDKDYLIFEHAFTIGKDWTSVSLIVAKRIPWDVSVADNGMTMTNLKKCIGMVVMESYFKMMDETRRMYPLIKELVDAGNRINNPDKRVAFGQPVRLGGQTYENQRGFGSEYHGRNEVIHGKEYGETTGFFVIGVIAE